MGENHHPIPLSRAEAFADGLGIRLPILLAPMGGCMSALLVD
jgi:hypothetical protein